MAASSALDRDQTPLDQPELHSLDQQDFSFPFKDPPHDSVFPLVTAQRGSAQYEHARDLRNGTIQCNMRLIEDFTRQSDHLQHSNLLSRSRWMRTKFVLPPNEVGRATYSNKAKAALDAVHVLLADPALSHAQRLRVESARIMSMGVLKALGRVTNKRKRGRSATVSLQSQATIATPPKPAAATQSQPTVTQQPLPAFEPFTNTFTTSLNPESISGWAEEAAIYTEAHAHPLAIDADFIAMLRMRYAQKPHLTGSAVSDENWATISSLVFEHLEVLFPMSRVNYIKQAGNREDELFSGSHLFDRDLKQLELRIGHSLGKNT